MAANSAMAATWRPSKPSGAGWRGARSRCWRGSSSARQRASQRSQSRLWCAKSMYPWRPNQWHKRHRSPPPASATPVGPLARCPRWWKSARTGGRWSGLRRRARAGGEVGTVEEWGERQVGAAQHRAGLRRLFALQIKDAVKSLEKNIPGLHAMAVAYMHVGRLPDGTGAGTPEELRKQIIDLALERAFMPDPLPADEDAFRRRVDEGRERLALIANEVARLAAPILAGYAAAARKIRGTRNAPEATQDAQQQLQRLMPKNFIAATPWTQLLHYARSLKAITLRLDKIRADPARDAARLAELRPQEQRYWRLVAERKGAIDARMQELRWLLEELRVSFFAQELRTPQRVRVKRLDKLWAQIKS